jgi:hypothetical protein
MSKDEMREQCLSLSNFKLRVEVRMKNGSDIMVGRIGSVESERFELVGDDSVVQSLQYAWVARIKNHMTGSRQFC